MSRTLTLNRKNIPQDEEQSTEVIIGVYDALLPCRNYKIEHKIAEVGKVSLTTEFLLRLVHSIDGVPEAEVAKFFDFSPQEMTFLLNDAVSLDYVSREAGRLWLTPAGRGLFLQNDDEPQIFNVEKRNWTQGFDLVSFAPQEKDRTEPFDNHLHVLEVDQNLVSRGKEQVPPSFKKHFAEITSKQGLRSLLKRSLYSIDSVSPEDKFSAVVPIIVKASQPSLNIGEPDLLEWRPDHELDDRAPIAGAIGRFVESLRVQYPEHVMADYELLLELAPEFLRSYSTKSGLSVDRYLRDAVSLKDHKFKINRKTVAIVGPFFSEKNAEVLLEAVARAVVYTPAACIPPKFYWRAPLRRFWGATRALPNIVARVQSLIADKLGDDESPPVSVIMLEKNWHSPHRAFTEKQYFDNGSPPQSVEIFLVPGVAAGVLIHLPGASTSGHVVPLGFMSVDPLVIFRIEEYLKQYGPLVVPQERVTEEDLDLPEE